MTYVVSLGAFIFCTSLFGLVVIWRKHYRLIFLSGIFLVVVFVTLIVVTTVQLTLNYETTKKLDRVKMIAQVTTESILQVVAIVITFFMSTKRPPYRGTIGGVDSDEEREHTHVIPDSNQMTEIDNHPMDRSFDRRSRRSYNLVPNKEDTGLDM